MDKAAWIDPYNRVIPFITRGTDDSTHLAEIIDFPKKYGINSKQATDLQDIYNNAGEDALAEYLASLGWVRFRASDGLTYFSGGKLNQDRATDLANAVINKWPALAKLQQNCLVSVLKGKQWSDLGGTSRYLPTIKQIADGALFKNEALNKIFNKLERLFEGMEEKEQWFEDRTKRHIELVNKAAEMIATYPKEEFRQFDVNQLVDNCKNHDKSKFEEPERTPYIGISWRHKLEDKDFDPINGKGYQTPGKLEKKEENDATLHHITTNSHHPEYWNKENANLSAECRDESDNCIDASKMSNLAIAEMVADWQAMSWELKKNTAREWFNKQKDVRWHFSPEQEKLIDKLLKVFE